MSAHTCHACGTAYRAGSPFCPSCGEPPGASPVTAPPTAGPVATQQLLVEPLLPLTPLPPEVVEAPSIAPATAAPPLPTPPAQAPAPPPVEVALEPARATGERQVQMGTLLIAGGVVLVLAATAVGVIRRGSGDDTKRATSAPASTAAVVTTAGGFSVSFDSSTAATTAPAAPDTTVATTVPPPPVTAAPPETTLPPETTAVPETTAPPDTAPPGGVIELRTIGSSVDGTPIVALRRGTPGGRVAVAVGVIHGDRAAGLAVTSALRDVDVPPGIDLWVIDTINPDGVARGSRTNAHGVDLNRNFASADWQAVGVQGDTWAGRGPASEPETQALQSFLQSVQPSLMVWWDQFTSPLVDDGEDVTRPDLVRYYASITGLPVIRATCKGTPCVGNATTFVNRNIGGTSFTVSLPANADGFAHADAFLRVAAA